MEADRKKQEKSRSWDRLLIGHWRGGGKGVLLGSEPLCSLHQCTHHPLLQELAAHSSWLSSPLDNCLILQSLSYVARDLRSNFTQLFHSSQDLSEWLLVWQPVCPWALLSQIFYCLLAVKIISMHLLWKRKKSNPVSLGCVCVYTELD